ncbi:VOC family protein [Lentilactobacillus senioris]|uniref:VOC family protein n=1 Tax=Lentilactobacillus senioris TaxID=931534 RepID=UPI003D2CB027
MNIREIEALNLPVSNLQASLRFYHEVFDLPILELADDVKAARLAKQLLIFSPKKVVNPIEFSVVAKDSVAALESHLANYGVDIKQPAHTVKVMGRDATAIVVADLDDNLITINTYAQKG